jgi:hypothetical protein
MHLQAAVTESFCVKHRGAIGNKRSSPMRIVGIQERSVAISRYRRAGRSGSARWMVVSHRPKSRVSASSTRLTCADCSNLSSAIDPWRGVSPLTDAGSAPHCDCARRANGRTGGDPCRRRRNTARRAPPAASRRARRRARDWRSDRVVGPWRDRCYRSKRLRDRRGQVAGRANAHRRREQTRPWDPIAAACLTSDD